jgi:hypothetical protein
VPNIEVVEDAGGFELVATAEALVQLADAMREATRVEVGSDTGAVVVLPSEGPVAFSHVGRRVEVVGGRSELDQFADALRFVAAGPALPSTVRYHLHIEYYDDHPWLAAHSEPAVIVLAD